MPCTGLFFFSSRRRHTRSLCDWSSDVCSSDLGERRRRNHDAWPELEAAGRRVRLVRQDRTQGEGGIADADRVAEMQLEARQQPRSEYPTPVAVALGERRIEHLRTCEQYRA